jgi:hypothetical protein
VQEPDYAYSRADYDPSTDRIQILYPRADHVPVVFNFFKNLFNLLFSGLREDLGHELIHREQHRRREQKTEKPGSLSLPRSDDKTEYIKQKLEKFPEELMPYARDAVLTMKRRGLSSKEILEILSDRNKQQDFVTKYEGKTGIKSLKHLFDVFSQSSQVRNKILKLVYEIVTESRLKKGEDSLWPQ